MADTKPLNPPWLQSKWDELKGKMKEEWGKLTKDDLDRAEASRDQAIGAVQQRYGIARGEGGRTEEVMGTPPTSLILETSDCRPTASS